MNNIIKIQTRNKEKTGIRVCVSDVWLKKIGGKYGDTISIKTLGDDSIILTNESHKLRKMIKNDRR